MLRVRPDFFGGIILQDDPRSVPPCNWDSMPEDMPAVTWRLSRFPAQPMLSGSQQLSATEPAWRTGV